MSMIHFLRRNRRYAIGEYAASGYHPTVSTWAANVVANGGAAPASSTLAALSTFMYALDSANLTISMKVINVFAPDNLTAALTPLIATNCSNPWTNHNFVSGDLNANGLKGNGTTKYADLGALSIPSTIYANETEAGYSVYLYEGGQNASENTFGCATNNTFANAFSANMNTTGSPSFYTSCWTPLNANGFLSWSPGAAFYGFVTMNRISAIRMDFYRANSGTGFSSVANLTGTSGLRPTTNFYSHAVNAGGSPNSYSYQRFSFLAIHDGLSSASAQALFNAVQTMRTTLGGGFI